MLIHIGYDVVFNLIAPTPFFSMLNLHPSRLPSLQRKE